MRIKTKYIILLCIICFGFLAFYAGRQSFYYDGKTFNAIYSGQRVAMLNTQSKQVTNCDMLFIGDSLVDGMYFQSTKKNVFLSGVGGSTVEDWRAWSSKLIEELAPKTLMIALGVNNTSRDLKFDIKDFIKNYQEICSIAKEQGVEEIIILSVLPVGKDQVLGNLVFDSEAIKNINTALQKLAKENYYIYLDTYSHFVNEEGFIFPNLTTDGVHLTEKGYILWKKLIFADL